MCSSKSKWRHVWIMDLSSMDKTKFKSAKNSNYYLAVFSVVLFGKEHGVFAFSLILYIDEKFMIKFWPWPWRHGYQETR